MPTIDYGRRSRKGSSDAAGGSSGTAGRCEPLAVDRVHHLGVRQGAFHVEQSDGVGRFQEPTVQRCHET
jgi:hypothetical protein